MTQTLELWEVEEKHKDDDNQWLTIRQAKWPFDILAEVSCLNGKDKAKANARLMVLSPRMIAVIQRLYDASEGRLLSPKHSAWEEVREILALVQGKKKKQRSRKADSLKKAIGH